MDKLVNLTLGDTAATPERMAPESCCLDGKANCWVLDSLYDGVYLVDTQRRILYWNEGAQQISGYTQQDAIGRFCFDNFLSHVDNDGCQLCFGGCPLAATLADGKRREDEIYLRHRDGHRVPVRVRVAPVRDAQQRIVGAIEVFTDISAVKQVERRVEDLEELAYKDPLTGLYNRRYMQLKIEQAVDEFARFGRAVAVLMIDLDNFKNVNDSYGHETGDRMLQTVSRTLARSVRGADSVGRWGGEEFLVLLPEVDEPTLAAVAERCRTLIAQSIVTVHGNNVSVSASLGAARAKAGESAADLVRLADKLMYRSKSEGRNRVSFA